MPTTVGLTRVYFFITSSSATRSATSLSSFLHPTLPASCRLFTSRCLGSKKQHFSLFSSSLGNEETIESSPFSKQRYSTSATSSIPNSMADDILNNKENSINPLFNASPSFSCPCCSFLSYNDLFLPSSITGETEKAVGKAAVGVDEEDGKIMSPHDALEKIIAASQEKEEDNKISKDEKQRKRVLLVDTHGHPHLDRERQADYITPSSSSDEENDKNNSHVMRLSCAVSESDLTQTLQYASQSKSILPALGIHPWYLSNLSPNYLQNLEGLLQQHSNAIVGEIGLCKVAKFIRTYEEGKTAALELQRRVFKEQLELAVKLKRPVSVHCVQQHGVFLSLLKEMKEEAKVRLAQESKQKKDGEKGEGEASSAEWCLADAFPPKIGMHSFTGTAHHVKELLAFEESLYETSTTSGRGKKSKKKKKKKDGDIKQVKNTNTNNDGKVEKDDEKATQQQPQQQMPPPPKRKPIFYFGFSHSINVLMCSSAKSRKQGMEAIRAVPTNRLLAESDVHSHDDVPAATAGSVAYIAKAIDCDLVETAELTALNGFEFLGVGGAGDVSQQQQ